MKMCILSRNVALSSALVLFSATSVVNAAPYIKTLDTTYHGQETANEPGKFYCGAATAQMILDTSTVLKNPAPLAGPPAKTTQDRLYDSAQANKGVGNGNYFINPVGLKGALTQFDPPAGGRSYVAYNVASYETANRILGYDIDHYGVTAGALIYKGGHWVNVYGVMSDVKPITGTYTVYGFDIHDPWTGTHGGGLGENSYLANTYMKKADGSKVGIGLWNKHFTPTNYGGAFQGNYAFVADPDPDESGIDLSPDPYELTSVDASNAISFATTDLAAIPELSSDLSFENGAFTGTGEFTLDIDTDGVLDFLVPYYQTGMGEPSGVAAIDGQTGALVGAFWDEGDLSDPLAPLAASLASEFDGSAVFLTDNVLPEPSALALLVPAGLLLSRRRR